MAPSDNAMIQSTIKGSDCGEPDSKPGWGGGEELIESFQAGCCGRGQDIVSPWFDWVQGGVEFFECEVKAGKEVLDRALRLRKDDEEAEESRVRDYAALHEQFFESLLKEQFQLSGKDSSGIPGLELAESRDESISSGVSSGSSVTYEMETSVSSTKTQKRRRPLKLGKLSPRRRHHARIAPIEAYNRQYNPALNSNQVSLPSIASKPLPDPSTFLHPFCLLQKDKGKGDKLGSSISAEGSDQCVEKLREKMSIVVQVSGEERNASTGMKRRPAKVSEHTPTYIETRSMIELRLGFLSMQYGLLLRWDYQRTGKVTFVALRKMCHDSFYNKAPDLHPLGLERKETTITEKQAEMPPLVVRNRIGNHAVYQLMMGTEVELVEPPYRVPQPKLLAPSVLTVQVKDVTGLSKKSRWTISISFANRTEAANLQYNPDKRIFESRGSPMTWETTPMTSFDLASVEVSLFEIPNKRKRSHSRLVSTMTMPLGGLVAQPSTSEAASWNLTMPFTHDVGAKLSMTLTHQSQSAYWLYQELDARRAEEARQYQPSFAFRKARGASREEESAPEAHFLDWLCGICYKEIYLPENIAQL